MERASIDLPLGEAAPGTPEASDGGTDAARIILARYCHGGTKHPAWIAVSGWP
jgi:hypothetical protein